MILNFYENRESNTFEVIPRFFKFPDGQPHVTIDADCSLYSEVSIRCSIRNPDELFDLLMIHDVLSRYENLEINLYIYWLFGARMDRAIDNKQPSTFKIIKEILYPRFKHVFVLDLHNHDAFPECSQIFPSSSIQSALKDFGECDIFFPDKGARERYKHFYLFEGMNILHGQKKRNPETGKLSGFELADGEKKSDSILIIDDLCDGGGTFVGQHENVLKPMGYQRVGLYVTHGIFSKGIEVLDCFDAIYSTNSFVFGQSEDKKIFLRKYSKKIL